VKLTIVGCSPAWPNPGGAQSGYLVEHDGKRLLLDCGPGVLARLRELEAWPTLDAIAITHWHLDQWGDLVPWVWGVLAGPGGKVPKPELWVPPGGRELVRGFGAQLGFEDMFERTFEVREYQGDEPFEAAGLHVTAHRMPHYDLPTFGFRVSDGSSTLAYSGDSGPCRELAELARGVDLFVCEATLDWGDREQAIGTRGHLAPEEAVEAFETAGAGRLLITHRPHERELEHGLEQVFDGMQIEL
jgi:ribonuclease BN (tRNA processing enzyme)